MSIGDDSTVEASAVAGVEAAQTIDLADEEWLSTSFEDKCLGALRGFALLEV